MVPASGQDELAVRAKSDRHNPALVVHYCSEGRSPSSVPKTSRSIFASCQDRLPIRTESHSTNDTLVFERRPERLAAGHVPEVCLETVASCQHSLPIRAENTGHRDSIPEGRDIALMVRQLQHEPAGSHIPQARYAVGAAREEELAVGTDCQRLERAWRAPDGL